MKVTYTTDIHSHTNRYDAHHRLKRKTAHTVAMFFFSCSTRGNKGGHYTPILCCMTLQFDNLENSVHKLPRRASRLCSTVSGGFGSLKTDEGKDHLNGGVYVCYDNLGVHDECRLLRESKCELVLKRDLSNRFFMESCSGRRQRYVRKKKTEVKSKKIDKQALP